MSIKDLTRMKHAKAESTKFMRAVFKKEMPMNIWTDWTYQKTLFYGTIEGAAGTLGLLDDLPDIRRNFYLWKDVQELNTGPRLTYKPVTKKYHNYLMSISNDKDKILAHLYVWHLGDLFGGQMIKDLVPATHHGLNFQNPGLLIQNLRAKVNDSHAEEANYAYEWAISVLRSYDSSLG